MENNDNEFFEIDDHIRQLFEKLENFNEYSRNVYTNLSKYIPKSIEKILKSLKDLSFNIDLVSNLDLDNQYSLNNFIGEIINTINDFVNYFNSSTDALENQFSVISEKIKDIEILEDVIFKMKESSLDMEIMSINTLTVAMRAGKAGGAFSYITSEIKLLTQSMIKHADQLTNKGQEVKSGLDRTKNQIYESTSTENKILEEFRNNLMKKMDEFSDKVGETIAIYDSMLITMSNLKFKFVNSISYLQFQDRLTQSLQHLNIMYSNIEVFKVREISEIQKIKILSIFTDSAKMIVREVIDKLDENSNIFEEFISNSVTFIQDIDNQRHENSLYLEISSSIDFFVETLSNLLKGIDEVEKNNSNFLNLYYEQIKLVKSLELMFINISSISSRFQNINIASKIEVVKSVELEDMEGNISEMSKIIREIDFNIKKGSEFLDQIVFFIEKVVKDYDNKFYLEKNYFNKFKKLFSSIKNNIFEIKKLVLDDILSYEIFPIDFLESFEEIKQEISNINNLKENLILIEDFLKTMGEDIDAELGLLMLKAGINSVEVEDKDFVKRIANRFTLFSHKQYLLSLVEETKDTHSFDEGSVILF